MTRTVRKAIIPAGGLGTRFLPATKAQPKEMLPLVDKPIVQYVVEEAVASGITDILIVTGRGKRALEDHFDRSLELEQSLHRKNDAGLLADVRGISELADIYFVRQKEPLGLGHAILTGRRHIGEEPFAVLLGDEVFTGEEPCLRQLITAYERTGAQTVIGVREVPWPEVSRYGIVAAANPEEEAFRLSDLVEKPASGRSPSNIAIIGRYILPPEVFAILEETSPGYGGEIQLTDALKVLAGSGDVWGARVRGKRFDVGDKLGFLKATVEMALARPDLAGGFLEFLTETVAARLEEAPRGPRTPDGRPG
jgi:UTP--glucose-1-phosphate uridylyltransferase